MLPFLPKDLQEKAQQIFSGEGLPNGDESLADGLIVTLKLLLDHYMVNDDPLARQIDQLLDTAINKSDDPMWKDAGVGMLERKSIGTVLHQLRKERKRVQAEQVAAAAAGPAAAEPAAAPGAAESGGV